MIYGFMKKEEKEHYSYLLSLEINSFLRKIYRVMKRSVPLKRPVFSKDMLILRTSSSATKSFEFKLNSRDLVRKGKVGKVIVVTDGLKNPLIRKQRALFIAAEIYTYHAFANHPDPSFFDRIKSQNQILDMFRKIFGRENSHDLRDKALRYVIEEIDEHKLAQTSGFGWYTRIAKVKSHDYRIADILGSSEKVFRRILKKQQQQFTPEMLKSEEHLVRKEIEDVEFLIDYLESVSEDHPRSHLSRHIPKLRSYVSSLNRISDNLHRWFVQDKEEHKLLSKGDINEGDVRSLIASEAEASMIDINKIYILFQHFEKEKINILKEADTFLKS